MRLAPRRKSIQSYFLLRNRCRLKVLGFAVLHTLSSARTGWVRHRAGTPITTQDGVRRQGYAGKNQKNISRENQPRYPCHAALLLLFESARISCLASVSTQRCWVPSTGGSAAIHGRESTSFLNDRAFKPRRRDAAGYATPPIVEMLLAWKQSQQSCDPQSNPDDGPGNVLRSVGLLHERSPWLRCQEECTR